MNEKLCVNTPLDLFEVVRLFYVAAGFQVSHLHIFKESVEYGACSFVLNGLKVLFRVAKVTPTKIGQFVTLWKRELGGPIQSYDASDDVDLVLVVTRSAEKLGHFVFNKKLLIEQGIFSNQGKKGKLAIRVYPAWDTPDNKQAQKSQLWQLKYFMLLHEGKSLDLKAVEKLYGLKPSV